MRSKNQITLTAIVCAAIILLLCAALGGKAYAYTDEQEQLHELAEYHRNELGCGGDCDAVRTLQKRWQAAEREVEILATVIGNEAPYCTPEHQELVGQVVVNRVRSPLFPNSMEEVVNAPGQYLKAYTDPDSRAWKKVREDPELYAACRAAAEKVLNGEVDCPANVLFQSEFRNLGDGIYKEIYVDTGWYQSTTYFCYVGE